MRLITILGTGRRGGGVWRWGSGSQFGLAVRHYAGNSGKQDLSSNLLWLSFVFKNGGLWTLSCEKVILVVTV